MEPFDIAWDALAEVGQCDARGGMEYERVKGEWEAEMLMVSLVLFIRQSANRPAPAPPTTPDAKEGAPCKS